MPGEHELVEALVTGNSTTGLRVSSGRVSESNAGRVTGDRSRDGGLEALSRYLSSGDPTPAFSATASCEGSAATPPPRRGSNGGHQQQQQEEDEEEEQRTHRRGLSSSGAGNEDDVALEMFDESPRTGDSSNTINGSGTASSTDDRSQQSSFRVGDDVDPKTAAGNTPQSGRSPDTAAAAAAAAAVSPPPASPGSISAGAGIARPPSNAMPEARVREYSVTWRVPPAVCYREEGGEEVEEGSVGARLYARVTSKGGERDGGGDERRVGGGDVRLAVSVAEPAYATSR